MLGSWAAGMKHSFFTFKIYTCQYLTKIRTVPETIKTAILIKCVKPIQCPWYIKEFKNFNNNSNIQKKKLSPRCGRVLGVCLYLVLLSQQFYQLNIKLAEVAIKMFSTKQLLNNCCQNPRKQPWRKPYLCEAASRQPATFSNFLKPHIIQQPRALAM